jgi:uncharacterized protein YkwD
MQRPSLGQRLASIVAVVVVLVACGAEPSPDAVAARLLAEVNVERVAGRVCGARGAYAPTHALVLEARLTAAAWDHANDMHARRKMGHTGGDGSQPGDRIERAGYGAAAWGENVAVGFRSVDAVMAGWLGSDGHCAILMSPSYTEFGAAETGLYWAQVFARPR